MASLIAASGIYRIAVARGNDIPFHYIGQATCLGKRYSHHLRFLKSGRHKNIILQRAFDKYGDKSISFEILIVCSQEMLTCYEQMVLDYEINRIGSAQVLNICRECTTSRIGLTTSSETRAKMSAAALGKVRSEETRAKISAAKRGRKPSPRHVAHLKRLADNNTGRSPPEHVHAAARAAKLGTKKSAEELARRQATRRANAEARGYWCSPEWRTKQSARLDLRQRNR